MITSPLLGHMRQVVETILAHRITGVDEYRLQAGLADVFTQQGLAFEREVVLTTADRIDFLHPDGIGIECKVKDSPSKVASQVVRYLRHDRVQGLILVTNQVRLGHSLPASLSITGQDGVVREKPILIAALWRNHL
jgi:hypothetical protein